MKNDTRDKNEYFDDSSIASYLGDYTEALHDALLGLDKGNLELARLALLECTEGNKRIFVGGNGGSSAIAEHLTCDFQKGCQFGVAGPHCLSMTSNTALLTAVANDLSYAQIFSYQMDSYGLTSDELVILISSSGNSPNIVAAVKYAQNIGAKVIGLSGFDGGFLKEHADISLHVPFYNYGIVEDSHQAIMHMLAQFTYLTIKSSTPRRA